MAQKKHTGWERSKKRRTQIRIEKSRQEREARTEGKPAK